MTTGNTDVTLSGLRELLQRAGHPDVAAHLAGPLRAAHYDAGRFDVLFGDGARSVSRRPGPGTARVTRAGQAGGWCHGRINLT